MRCAPWQGGMKPSADPQSHTADFLMKFLRFQNIIPVAEVPEYITLNMSLVGASSAGDVVKLCNRHQDGLEPINIAMALAVLAKYADDLDQVTAADHGVQVLVSIACARAHEFKRDHLVKVMQFLAKLGANGSHLLPLAEAVSLTLPVLKAEDLGFLAFALEATLGNDSRLILAKIAMVSMEKLHSFSWRSLLSVVLALTKGRVQAEAFLLAAAPILAPRVKGLYPNQFALLVQGYAELGVQHDVLLGAFVEGLPQDLARFSPEELANVAWGFWSFGVTDHGLMQRIGEAATTRLGELNRAQLDKIECAYGACGFVIPEEWVNHS